MGRKVSEVAKFFDYYDRLGEEAKVVVATLVKEKLHGKKPQVSRRNPPAQKKSGLILPNSRITGGTTAKVE